MLITAQGFEVWFSYTKGPSSYVAWSAPGVVQELMRLANLDSVKGSFHGDLAKGRTGGPWRTAYHVTTKRRSMWLQRQDEEVRIAIRPWSKTATDAFPPPLHG